MASPRRSASERLAELEYVILGCVGSYPHGVHGYRLGRTLSCSPLGVPSLRLGQLYRVLHHLESVGLVQGEVELNGSTRVRYRFTITPRGRTAFHRWLRAGPRGSTSIRDQLFNRLRFADQLPGSVLSRFLEEAVRECQREEEELQREHAMPSSADGRPSQLHVLALEARLLADRRWLEAVRGVVKDAGSSAAPTRSGP